MSRLFRPMAFRCGLLILALTAFARAQPLVRTPATTLRVPTAPPATAYSTPRAFPSLSFTQPVALVEVYEVP